MSFIQTRDSKLKFLIGLKHEIEHQMTSRIDEHISAKLQACCLNYNDALKNISNKDIAHYQPISIQFFSFGEKQIDSLKDKEDIPKNIIDFIASYETSLDNEEMSSPHYSYKVFYMRDNANREGQADHAVRFISEESAEGKDIHDVIIKNRQYIKLTQSQAVEEISNYGLSLTKYDHQKLWQKRWRNADIRNAQAKEFGELVVNNQWLWYKEKWIPEVIKELSTVS